MKQAASARSIARARADNTAGRSSISRQGGDGDVIPEPEEGWRVRVAPPRDTRVAPLGSTQVAASERVRVAPPGSVRAAPPGRVRVGMLDRPIVRVFGVHYDGEVSRY